MDATAMPGGVSAKAFVTKAVLFLPPVHLEFIEALGIVHLTLPKIGR